MWQGIHDRDIRLARTETSAVSEHAHNTGHKPLWNVHTATRWTGRHGLMLIWFADLMNVTEEVTIHRPNVSTLLSSAFIRGDLNAATRGSFI